MDNEIREISIESLHPFPDYENYVDEADTMPRLKEDIIKHGLEDPLIVYEYESKIYIISGYQRFKICKELNYKTLPCIMLNVQNEKEVVIILIENNLFNTDRLRNNKAPIGKGVYKLCLFCHLRWGKNQITVNRNIELPQEKPHIITKPIYFATKQDLANYIGCSTRTLRNWYNLGSAWGMVRSFYKKYNIKDRDIFKIVSLSQRQQIGVLRFLNRCNEINSENINTAIKIAKSANGMSIDKFLEDFKEKTTPLTPEFRNCIYKNNSGDIYSVLDTDLNLETDSIIEDFDEKELTFCVKDDFLFLDSRWKQESGESCQGEIVSPCEKLLSDIDNLHKALENKLILLEKCERKARNIIPIMRETWKLESTNKNRQAIETSKTYLLNLYEEIEKTMSLDDIFPNGSNKEIISDIYNYILENLFNN